MFKAWLGKCVAAKSFGKIFWEDGTRLRHPWPDIEERLLIKETAAAITFWLVYPVIQSKSSKGCGAILLAKKCIFGTAYVSNASRVKMGRNGSRELAPEKIYLYVCEESGHFLRSAADRSDCGMSNYFINVACEIRLALWQRLYGYSKLARI